MYAHLHEGRRASLSLKTENQIKNFLGKLAQTNFCGCVELSYSHGEVMKVRTIRTLLPEELDKEQGEDSWLSWMSARIAELGYAVLRQSTAMKWLIVKRRKRLWFPMSGDGIIHVYYLYTKNKKRKIKIIMNFSGKDTLEIKNLRLV